jgi:outer membrane receptor protein involved in Fe transport
MTSSLRVATRSLLLAGIAALALPARALAQEEPEELAQPAEAAEDAPVQAGNEIIVTATKREQTLQEIPVAVSVTTAETIERAQIRDITDLQTVVPSLRVTQSQGQFATTYNIRGFGTSGNNLGLEPSVAVFVDGVYRSRAISQISDFPDLQRVEVLRGPQSTLFGKNASAGVISIVSRKPRFDFGGQVEASYGIWDAMVLKGYVTGPISETVAASLAAGYNRRDGYLTNLATGTDVNDRNRWFTRGQLLFEPSDTLSVRLIGDYDEIDEVCCGVLNFRRSAATLAVEAVGGRVNDPNRPFDDEIYSDVDPVSKVRNWGLSGQVDYEIGPLTATSITAYRDTRLRADQDVDFTSARLATGANVGQADIETFTQEVRLATNLQGPLNVLIGGYYFNERLRTKDQIVYGADFRSYVNLLVGGLSGGQLNAPTLENLFGVPSGTFFAAGQGFFNDLAQDSE